TTDQTGRRSNLANTAMSRDGVAAYLHVDVDDNGGNSARTTRLLFSHPDGSTQVYGQEDLPEGWVNVSQSLGRAYGIYFLPDGKHVLVQTGTAESPTTFNTTVVIDLYFSKGLTPEDGYEDRRRYFIDEEGNTISLPGVSSMSVLSLEIATMPDGEMHFIFSVLGGAFGSEGTRHIVVGRVGHDQFSYDIIASDSGYYSIFDAVLGNNMGNWDETIRDYAFAVDHEGEPHVVINWYENDQATLKYMYRKGGDWETEVIASVFEPANPTSTFDSFTHANPSIAVYPDGRVAVAWGLSRRVATLSVQFTHLRYSVRNLEGNWSTSTIVNSADGYCGNDGCGHTGGLPQLFIDYGGRAHLFFTDIGRSHFSGFGQLTYPGNLRYAQNTGNGWSFHRVYRMTNAPRGDDDPDVEIKSYTVGMTHGGDRIAVHGDYWLDDFMAEPRIVEDKLFQVRIDNPVIVEVEYPTLDAPDGLTYPASSTTGRFTVSWEAVEGAAVYRLERSNNGGATWSERYTGSGLEIHESLINGDYRYRVRAENNLDYSIWHAAGYDCMVRIETNPISPDEEQAFRQYIRHFYLTLLDREPEPGALDAWMNGYDRMVEMNLDVRFLFRDVSRIFIFSEEYQNRQRNDEEFIRDCYAAFMERVPSQGEIDAWVPGDWTRPPVLTHFTESEEFENRVVDIFPGREGIAVNNFASTMYFGALDRFIDPAGLDYWAGEFLNAPDVRQRAREMFFHLTESDEYLSNDPTAGDYVTSLYRSFMGRFPADNEIEFWSSEIVNQRQSLDQVADFFSNSEEFTARLVLYGLISGK
ncbi:MAG: DUF4214 domain-containing protein, partial [Candidatus Sumerlaeia bacterium]|nr:DUF4214 domain-containing protein [Candidatus Sumerlaeia bacterium]